MKRLRKCEILAPAGSAEQLTAAVNNGCDSVYLGLDSFNARMKAPNFTEENLAYWVDFCHLYGVKVYVAINTSLKNDEFDKAVEMLKSVYAAKADGVILTDVALIGFAAKLPKPFEIVASTQLNVHDALGARFVKEHGATTVVCARECSLQQIKEIASVGINVECFIHGATCVCQSGQCLFSSMVGGNSGNRGLCAQPCRKLYSANGKLYYLLSARDLLGTDVARNLYEAGVSTYKIEGRNRRAEYAGATSRVYRKLFDNDFEYSKEDIDLLAEVYNRDMAKLSYIDGSNSGIISPLCQNHSGVAVGTVCGKAIKTDKKLSKGDGFKIFSEGREVCGAVATASGSGLVSAEFGGNVTDGMEVRRTTSVELCNKILSERRLLPVEISFATQPNQPVVAKARYNSVEICLKFDDVIAAKAQNKPLSVEEIKMQLQKSGNSPFTVTKVAVNASNVFLAKSQLNYVRRTLLDKLQQAVIEHYDSKFDTFRATNTDDFLRTDEICSRKSEPTVAVRCYTENELERASKLADMLLYKPNCVDGKSITVAHAFNAFLDLPSFADANYLREELVHCPTSVVCHNVGQVQLARALNLPYIAGSGLNIFNDRMASQFDDAVTFVYSLELTLNEISNFADRRGLIFADGKLTLMQWVHCPYKLQSQLDGVELQCAQCNITKPLYYRDESGNRFTVERRKAKRCSFELQNGKKLSVVSKIKRPDRFLVDFDEAVVWHYISLNKGIDDGYEEPDYYTKGRLFDKVN